MDFGPHADLNTSDLVSSDYKSLRSGLNPSIVVDFSIMIDTPKRFFENGAIYDFKCVSKYDTKKGIP